MELQHLAVGLRRRKALLGLVTLLGVALAALVLQLAGPGTYQATATLLLDPTAVTTPQQKPFNGDPERYVGGQIRLLESEALAAQAGRKLPGQSVTSIVEAVTLSHVTGSDLVDVTAAETEPSRARDVANALADTYVEQRRAETTAAVDSQLAAVRKQLTDVQDSLTALRGLANAPERDVLLNQFESLTTQEAALRAPGVTQDNTAVIDPAVLPTSPHGLPRAPVLLLGLVLGLAAGGAAAVALEARRPHAGSTTEVERMIGRPVLASLPRMRRHNLLPGRSRATVRTAASILVAQPHEGRPRLVAIASVAEQGAAPTVCRALLEALRDQGLDAVMIDLGDPEEPEGRDRAWPGAGGDPAGSSARSASMPAGDVVMSEDRARTLVADLPSIHELVLLALPPVLQSPLAVAASRWVDDVVLVVDLDEVRQRELDLTWPLFDGASARRHVITHR